MNIGIDISQIVFKGTGVSRFTEGFINTILELDHANHWNFFYSSREKFDHNLAARIESKGHTVTTFGFPPSVLAFLHNDIHHLVSSFTFQSSGSFKVEKPGQRNLDWFITSDWTEPKLPYRKATIIHDLVFKLFPETVHPKIIHAHTQRLKWVTKESNLIFTDSYSTADDLKKIYNIEDARIIVNYPGVNQHIDPANEAHLQKFDVQKPFILAVGKLEPRKNIQRLIEAYSKLETSTQLIIVGPSGWGDMPVNTNKNIKFLGYISDDELATLYQSALCFIYPSLYEGFGYPLVEAMKYGCPTGTSDTSSLHEIGNDASLFFMPTDVHSISKILQTLISDELTRNQLITKGHERAIQFTWQRYYSTFITALYDHRN